MCEQIERRKRRTGAGGAFVVTNIDETLFLCLLLSSILFFFILWIFKVCTWCVFWGGEGVGEEAGDITTTAFVYYFGYWLLVVVRGVVCQTRLLVICYGLSLCVLTANPYYLSYCTVFWCWVVLVVVHYH